VHALQNKTFFSCGPYDPGVIDQTTAQKLGFNGIDVESAGQCQ
jgi:hypothetical protein